MQYQMFLVCHAADGHFADGNRLAVRRLLDRIAATTQRMQILEPNRYILCCQDGSRVDLYMPGLDGSRSFHRIELTAEGSALNADTCTLIYDLMVLGDFGLMRTLDTCSFIVTSAQQVSYYPNLPEPPLLVRNAIELGSILRQDADLICA